MCSVGVKLLQNLDGRAREILAVLAAHLHRDRIVPESDRRGYVMEFFLQGDYEVCRSVVVAGLEQAGPDWRDYFEVLTVD